MKFISRHGMNKIFKVNDETDEPIGGAKSHGVAPKNADFSADVHSEIGG